MFHLFRVPIVRGLLALIVAVLFVDQLVPVSVGAENGILELMQVAVLAVGAVVCAMKIPRAEGRYRCLWAAGFLLCLLLAGRELSWGRVFFPVMENGNYPPVKALPYGPVVYPLVGVTMVAILALIVRGKVVRYLRTHELPRTALMMLIVAAFLAVDGEKLHLIPYAHGMLVEEFCELCVYGLFVWMLTKMRPS